MAENKTLMQEFASFIKSKRAPLAMGISQTKLAERVFENPKMKSYISAIEKGKKDISMRTARKILEVLKSDMDISEFHTFVKTMRKQRGWSQSQLAEKIYGDPKMKSYISDIENERKDVTMNTAGYFCDVFEHKVQFLE